jgi:hypothetical protein
LKGISKPTTNTQLTLDEAAEVQECSLVAATVEENRKGFSQRQFKDAQKARQLASTLGFPTIQALRDVLKQRLIRNCPVTAQDVDNAEQIFGPNIAALKGKTTRQTPARIRYDYVDIPPEIKQQRDDMTLFMDIFFVCGLPILTSIDNPIKFRASVPLKDRKKEDIYRALDVIFRKYNAAGFAIKVIQTDPEFKPIMDEVKDDLEVTMDYVPTQHHVPEAERNIRTIKERIRSTVHGLPYKTMPKVMLKHCAMLCTNQLNFLPAKNRVSSYYSTHVILGGMDLDYNKHLVVPFGSYVQANQDNLPTNTTAPRTIDAIYLNPVLSPAGGHKLMNLHTGEVKK